MKDNVTRPHKGLHKDTSKIDQPKDSYLFALNAVNETELGDTNFIGNEESNEICDSLTPGFIPLSKIYIGNNQTAILSVSEDDVVSEIGILDDKCNYIVHVNDEDSDEEDKLNFKVSHQIQGVYRKRLGCENTIYWVDDLNRPRYFNFDSPDDFKNEDDTWNGKLFSLQKQYSKIPNFQSVETFDSGGNLEPGSYNIAIQYVDDSLNPTEWITVSPTVKIYNDLSNKEYRQINGSINSDTDYIDFPKTSKALRVQLSNLDSDFLYYRLAFIEATNGSGQVNGIKYTNVIPTSKNFFIYTGNNFNEKGTEAEIAQFSDIIHRAKNIEQIENRLILGNTQGKQVNFCKLQKYASRIKADCITKRVILSDINDPSNPKNPTHEFGGKGYMPGEIYSFGIVYIFEDGSLSPVYHIPGKSSDINPSTIFSPGNNVFPMSDKNQGSSTYTDNDSCNNNDYWGKDSEGIPLTGKHVRHHRFPLRSDINKPLVTDEIGDEQNVEYYNLILRIQGQLKTPISCPDTNSDCGTDDLPSFEVRVNYKVDGEDFFFTEVVDPATYTDETGNYSLDVYENSQFHGSNNFTNIKIYISNVNGDFEPESSFDNSIYWNNTPTFTTTVEPYTATVKGRVYSTEILGIKFSGVDLPNLEDTNGNKIVGYYIVRNERTEFDKTILDTGVLVPSVVNNKYVSHGLLQPETNKLSETVYGLIHPEHKFNNKEYLIYDEIIQQGNFNVIEKKYGKINYDDVYDGSSYNSKYQKDGNDDGHVSDGSPTSRGYDGWSVNIISRDNIVSFKQKNNFTFTNDDIKDRFYLSGLESRSINDNANDVYNITTDNKVGMINLKDGITVPSGNNLPYVVMKKNNLDPYSNFRVLPYYKDSVNPFYFDKDNSNDDICTVFGGDTYVSPMRYVNTTYWNNRVAKRKGKKSLLKIILGAIIAVIGAVLLVFTAGASTLVVGTGIALIGAGALIGNSGIKMANVNKAYLEEYDKGLRQTTFDDWVDAFYNYRNNSYTNPGDGTFGFQGNGGSGHDGPSDDTIQWIGDCITDLWFETSVNTNLRNHMALGDSPTFLDSPGIIESGNDTPLGTWEFFGLYYTNSNSQRYPVSSLERHLSKKLLAFDKTRDDNRYYIGLALGEYYNYNPDYARFNKQKYYFHLPLEYDCCSECQEDFLHRVHYSEQSFQEELSDNYRIFLPNNYRDIQGETGEITNIFKIGNNLFFHTFEGLWQQPRNYQERITDQIVSFIGTGDYFSIPPQKILDDDTGSSAGLQHKWSAIKTPYGYFFVCENQRKVYQFDGKQLKPISSVGLNNWFKENTRLKLDKSYYDSTGELYTYRDNPSNPFGTGFISTYDTVKERVIFTKKDFQFADGVIDSGDFEICVNNGQVVLFENFNQTIQQEAINGWAYVGMEDCKMKFEKTTIETKQEEREIITTIPNTADIHVFFDTSGSFGGGPQSTVQDIMNGNAGPSLQSINTAVDNWLVNFGNANPDWTGNIYKYTDSTERWVNYANIIAGTTYSGTTNDKDIIVISFCNEAHANYHGNSLENSIANPTGQFTEDYNNFINNIYPSYQSFLGIHYPIVFGAANGAKDLSESKNFLLHSIAALYGVPLTSLDISNELSVQNPGFTAAEWTQLLSALQLANPYPDNGLNNYGWIGKWDRAADASGNVINDSQFNDDIDGLLQTNTTTETITVNVQVETTEVKYIEGITVKDPIEVNNSWTISYSLKNNAWVSWHSYLPNFYMNVPEKFYSWIYGNNNIWKHNKKAHYQTFYGKYFPHILEYVSLSNPITTKIWDYLTLMTEARKFDFETNEYYDERFTTFNKTVLYNNRQCSGLLNLITKDTEINDEDYLMGQIINDNNVIIDRNERDWTINNFRDIRINYNKPIWNSNINSIQNEYFIDKILNDSTLDVNKNWTQMESFRDKYLAVRLIFDKFADIKLLTNYSVESEQESYR